MLILQQSLWNSEYRKMDAPKEACHVSEEISRIRGRVHAFGKNGELSKRAQGLPKEGGGLASSRRSMETAPADLTPSISPDSVTVSALEGD
jgi:hypothetical protein